MYCFIFDTILISVQLSTQITDFFVKCELEEASFVPGQANTSVFPELRNRQ